jgi:hypothetical protein
LPIQIAHDMGGVSVSWQSSIEVFSGLLRQRGVDPDAVADVHGAWAAFEEFQWGRWSWNDSRPSLSFTRQLAIPDAEDPDGQPGYWQVELEMTFPDVPSLVDLGELNESSTGFSFDPIGPPRARNSL